MKYKLTPHERQKSTAYLVTRDGEIVWATPAYTVWIGERIEKFLEWVDKKQVGKITIAGVECRPPRVTRTVSSDIME